MTTAREQYAAWKKGSGFLDLSTRAKLRLTGADRARYLNGQVTANVAKLSPGKTLPACITSAKGKLDAVVQIGMQGDALLVDAEPDQREAVLARLERYIIADDVTLEDVSESFGLLHLSGGVVENEKLFGDRPPRSAANRLGEPGWDVLAPAAEVAELLNTLKAEGFIELAAEAAEAVRIEQGTPRWGFELTAATLPPEAGLDRTHIDYHKGCYIGQEVISRLRSVGHVNRQLTGFIAEGGVALCAGWPLFAASDETRQVGVITSAAESFALSKPIAVGYLKRGTPDEPLIARAPDASAIEIRIHPLPFATSTIC